LFNGENKSIKGGLNPFWYGKTSGYFKWHSKQLDLLFKDIEVIVMPFNFLPIFFSVYYFLERIERGNSEYHNVFFHGAGIIKNGRGYIFTGPSGSGKSTICKYSIPDSIVINDELILASKKNGKFHLINCPIKGQIYESARHEHDIALKR